MKSYHVGRRRICLASQLTILRKLDLNLSPAWNLTIAIFTTLHHFFMEKKSPFLHFPHPSNEHICFPVWALCLPFCFLKVLLSVEMHHVQEAEVRQLENLAGFALPLSSQVYNLEAWRLVCVFHFP